MRDVKLPPVGDMDSVNAAMIMLRRFRKQLTALPPKLAAWVVAMLAASDLSEAEGEE